MKCFHCGGPSPTVICEKHNGMLPERLREHLQAAADVYWQFRHAATAWISLVERDDVPSEEELNALKNLIG